MKMAGEMLIWMLNFVLAFVWLEAFHCLFLLMMYSNFIASPQVRKPDYCSNNAARINKSGKEFAVL